MQCNKPSEGVQISHILISMRKAERKEIFLEGKTERREKKDFCRKKNFF
jgi:hypothetical protein